ncbi:hypothetical protein [Cohnella sp. REN36]|uniref:hypothetical protein n=1 Tax=Cohnella sp. REN36 TaxID=2887347 RepID=UPI001D15D04C|nr:hypothetical protein [Cohnella sp. REN36]MCC3376049.1 hypothetical protein [Cohnella sp. REN36]
MELIQNPVEVALPIQADWYRSLWGERDIGATLAESNDTRFVLESVARSDEGVDFRIRMRRDLDPYGGRLLSYDVFRDGGAKEINAHVGWWQYETKDGRWLMLMNRGTSFDGDDGFTMSVSGPELDRLADGFVARFSGLALYQYQRKK